MIDGPPKTGHGLTTAWSHSVAPARASDIERDREIKKGNKSKRKRRLGIGALATATEGSKPSRSSKDPKKNKCGRIAGA